MRKSKNDESGCYSRIFFSRILLINRSFKHTHTHTQLNHHFIFPIFVTSIFSLCFFFVHRHRRQHLMRLSCIVFLVLSIFHAIHGAMINDLIRSLLTVFLVSNSRSSSKKKFNEQVDRKQCGKQCIELVISVSYSVCMCLSVNG